MTDKEEKILLEELNKELIAKTRNRTTGEINAGKKCTNKTTVEINAGKKWTDEEEKILLEELNKNIDIKLIAKTHNRTTGGINARRHKIAYKLYSNNISMEEIIVKTKLNEYEITETIKKRQNITKINKPFSIENEIYEMKNDIKEIKNTINEVVGMMNTVYEFEDA